MSGSDRVLRGRSHVDYREVESDGDQSPITSDSEQEAAGYRTPLSSAELSLDSINNSVLNRTVIVDQSEEVLTMAATRVVQIVAELDSIIFQLEELNESVTDDVHDMSAKEVSSSMAEVKSLRALLVKLGSELKLLDVAAHSEHEGRITEILRTSKLSFATLRTKLHEIDSDKEKTEARQRQDIDNMERAKRESKISAFKRAAKEIDTSYIKLNTAYSIPAAQLTREQILKRHNDVAALSSEFDTFRDRVDRLIQQSDVVFPDKEVILDGVADLLAKLQRNKVLYEKRAYEDVLANDLTPEKLKLAQATKIDIGKFTGVLGSGDDFYTFKSKFLKTYSDHPKTLMVERLKNNHLEGVAKDCVGSLDDLDNIWARLKSNFGNTEQMLAYHFSKFNKLGHMNKQKTFSAKKLYLQTLINSMQDVVDLATQHNLLGELHYGPQLQKIVAFLENYLQTGWYKLITVEAVQKQYRWMRMIVYLEAQLSIIQTRAADCESSELSGVDNVEKKDNSGAATKKRGPSDRVNFTHKEVCNLCDESHPHANKTFVNCKKFLMMSRKQRGELVRKKQMCLQCLDGTTKWRNPKHTCCMDWLCPNAFHQSYTTKLHFLLCEHHADESENVAMLEKFKSEVMTAEWQQKLLKNTTLVAQIHPALVGKPLSAKLPVENNVIPDAQSFGSPVFLLQPVPFNNEVYNFLFDTGCKNFVSRKGAVDSLPDDCKQVVVKGPIVIGGVGDIKVTSPHGHYSVRLPIHDGRLATFSGVCLDVITGPLPPYPVREVRKSIVEGYTADGGKAKDLPGVPVLVGGDTDFLLGMQYNFFCPRLLFILPSGLAIYESMFLGVDGSRGCIGGAHELFSQCEKQFLETNAMNAVTDFRVYLNQQLSLFKSGYQVCLDHDALTVTNSFQPHQVAVVHEDADVARCELCMCVLVSSKIRLLGNADDAGSVIDYRCVKCRACADCKRGEKIEKVSMIEERDQSIIDSSITVNFDSGRTDALLPFTAKPSEKLVPNQDAALKVYKQQTKKLSKDAVAREAVLKSEDKLQQAGHVEWVVNLSEKDRNLLDGQASRYYMPWRYVTNENSISTPVRIVFDASSVTRSGSSLNDILAKGINSMNSMLEIVIRFRCYEIGVHTDVKMMYNVIKLKPEHWTYQRYLWDNHLDPSCLPSEKVIKTLIYGVKSSGNQAQCGLRLTAEAQQNEFPAAAHSIINDTYVDDCATGADGVNEAEQLALDINAVLSKGGFTTKGYTFAKRPPPPSLTKDGESVSVLGWKWFSEKDLIGLVFGPLTFARKYRGKRQAIADPHKIPDDLNRSSCLGKVHELFDLCGLSAPLMAGMKLDLRDLFADELGWEDPISTADHTTWVKNFQILVSIGEL